MFLHIAAAWACGGFVAPEVDYARSQGAQVLFAPGDGFVDVTWRTDVLASGTGYGWLIPIPGAFVELADGDARLDQLLYETGPLVLAETHDRVQLCSKNDLSGGVREVEVVASGFSGTYEYTVLEAPSSEALSSWADENGWALGNLASAADHYADHQLVLVRIAAATPGGAPPIRIRYEGDVLEYPAWLNTLSESPSQRLVLYVRGDGVATVDGPWTATPLGDVEGAEDEDPTSVYEAAITADGPSLKTVYAGDPGDGFVTRLEGIVPREGQEDLHFHVTDDRTEVRARVLLGDVERSGAWGLLPLALLLVRRR